MNILITSAGRRVSLVRAFQKELVKVYPKAKVFTSDSNPLLSAACHVADNYFNVPRLDDNLYINKLLDLCKDNQIGLIIPTIDTELLMLSKHQNDFEAVGVKILISDVPFIQKCRDKREIHRFFESHHIRVAKEFSKTNYQLPLFIKPTDGSRSVDTFIVEKEEDFTEYHFENDKLMFLEYLDHKAYDEYTCDLYYAKDGQLKCVVPRKRIEVRDGEVYKALTKRNALADFITSNLNYIEGARGGFAVQFFVNKSDETIVYGIEVNPRFGGGYPLSYLAGANFPKWIIEEYLLDNTIEDKFNSWESDLLMIRYDDEVLVHGYKD
ncbi:ATP-grasp domain-containing protein [Winogradskyella sp.]|uniref:ATP-grasp domain-containing protein n=1 Tax=Winogradskyella sp. TaxID=1883156 RepID=UPI00260D31A1|nr:ATP-grasp domain-containing protein [Winogradskyella sp.]